MLHQPNISFSQPKQVCMPLSTQRFHWIDYFLFFALERLFLYLELRYLIDTIWLALPCFGCIGIVLGFWFPDLSRVNIPSGSNVSSTFHFVGKEPATVSGALPWQSELKCSRNIRTKWNIHATQARKPTPVSACIIEKAKYTDSLKLARPNYCYYQILRTQQFPAVALPKYIALQKKLSLIPHCLPTFIPFPNFQVITQMRTSTLNSFFFFAF